MFLKIYTIVFAQIRIRQTSPQLLAAPRRHAAPRQPAHMLTNLSHAREVVRTEFTGMHRIYMDAQNLQ